METAVASTPARQVFAPDYLTNAMGDLYATVVDGHEQPVDPDAWDWHSPGSPEHGRNLEQIYGLPGYAVTVTSVPEIRCVPGPRPPTRPKGAGLLDWPNGAAPPAVALSKLGACGYYGRLSGALGWAVSALPKNPESRPFRVWDLVRGHHFVIDFAPTVRSSGPGCVYVVEDGLGIKVGHTTGEPAARIASLQTGNPRLISTIAVIASSGPSVEGYLHNELSRWAMQGEWFDRNRLLDMAREHGGWQAFLLHHLPKNDAPWRVRLFAPYR